MSASDTLTGLHSGWTGSWVTLNNILILFEIQIYSLISRYKLLSSEFELVDSGVCFWPVIGIFAFLFNCEHTRVRSGPLGKISGQLGLIPFGSSISPVKPLSPSLGRTPSSLFSPRSWHGRWRTGAIGRWSDSGIFKVLEQSKKSGNFTFFWFVLIVTDIVIRERTD